MGDGFHPPFKVEFLANTSFGARENDPYSSGRAGSHNSFLFSDTYKSLNCIKLNAKRTTPPLPRASKKKRAQDQNGSQLSQTFRGSQLFRAARFE